MTYLKLSLLSVSLAALMLGCGTESDEPPLVPEITSIEIEGETNSIIHSIIITDTSNPGLDTTQLYATVTYSDGSVATGLDSQLDWESNETIDPNDKTVMNIINGAIEPGVNQGVSSISASYRSKISTKKDKIITIVPLTDVNITSTDLSILYAMDKNTSDVNTSTSYSLKANGRFSDNNITENISSNIRWSSSNSTVATVDAYSGFLTTGVEGNATITVSVYDDINSSLDLNVTTP